MADPHMVECSTASCCCLRSGCHTAVAIMRMPADSASWQFSVGHDIVLRGEPMRIDKALALEHSNYMAVCQLACVERNCDFIAYSSRFCVMMSRNGGTDPRTIAGTAAAPVHSVMINMAQWNDWDAGECAACVRESHYSQVQTD